MARASASGINKRVEDGTASFCSKRARIAKRKDIIEIFESHGSNCLETALAGKSFSVIRGGFTTARQASGPPRSGAGVRVGILKGFVVSWKSQRSKSLIVQNHQDSAPIQNYERCQYVFKNVFDLVGFIYGFGLSTIIQDLLRFHHRIFLMAACPL